MSKIYRIEVLTLWPHPEANFIKRREMVYDFVANDLVSDERDLPDGRDFYDPKHNPHIYADLEKAESVYANLSLLLESWEPLAFMKDSEERIGEYRLISVDENDEETVEAESDRLGDLIAINEAFRKPQVA